MASTMNVKKKSKIPISRKSFWAFAVNWSEILLVLLTMLDDFMGLFWAWKAKKSHKIKQVSKHE